MESHNRPLIVRVLAWMIYIPRMAVESVRIQWRYFRIEREVDYELSRGNQEYIASKYPWIAKGVVLRREVEVLEREIEQALNSADHYCAIGDQLEAGMCYDRYRKLRGKLEDVCERMEKEVYEPGIQE